MLLLPVRWGSEPWLVLRRRLLWVEGVRDTMLVVDVVKLVVVVVVVVAMMVVRLGQRFIAVESLKLRRQHRHGLCNHGRRRCEAATMESARTSCSSAASPAAPAVGEVCPGPFHCLVRVREAAARP
jgi:hypothetical protein